MWINSYFVMVFNSEICYLQVFSDHESSLTPIDVPRQWLWNLPRRTVYFGTSIPTIFKGIRARNSLLTKRDSSFPEIFNNTSFWFCLLGLSTEGIQYCFWRGTSGHYTYFVIAASTIALDIKKQTWEPLKHKRLIYHLNRIRHPYFTTQLS